MRTAVLAPKARIINVASSGFDQAEKIGILSEGALWHPVHAVMMANVLFAHELQRRIDEVGLECTSACLHPGEHGTADVPYWRRGLQDFQRRPRWLAENNHAPVNGILRAKPPSPRN
jgi:hypothetical protein